MFIRGSQEFSQEMIYFKFIQMKASQTDMFQGMLYMYTHQLYDNSAVRFIR